ncbi:R3H domain-containing protein 1 isoform X4 [Hippocampus zosterae]|uniref:R3H domain-containing protein 1 isoform X4 n=1 Tax=Hippocampus zosterae TaxID=109293 RepID=UPI00223E21A5|nr:R3H domain-containing protein 1 isoform X4 [Hippocampus zosterae]
MRMSVQVDSETTKVPEPAAAEAFPKENATQSEVSNEGGKENSGSITTAEAKHKTRLKLVRSLAICEESFPYPILEPSAAPQDESLLRMFEKDNGATQSQAQKEVICDKVNKADKMLCRDSSQDYTDSTGIDLHQFLVNTLKSNPRDRIMLLKLEQDILDFISNNESQKRTFPPMTSYHRMLLHRVAAYFGMDHNVDLTGKSVVINKTTSTRIPDQKFSEHIKDDKADDFQKRYILKRDNSSFDRDDSTIRMRLKADKKSKSMEEREEEYQRARERIFAHDGDHFILDQTAQDEDACTRTQHRRLIFRSGAGPSDASWQSSSETETQPPNGEPRPWSSTDSSESSNRLVPRPSITKASSFSGISPDLARGDSTASSKSTGRLTKTGSESSGSFGSSSSSLSRPHCPFTVSVSLRPKISGTPFILPAADTKGSPLPDKSVPSQPTPSADGTNYAMSLEASGIPPGSILVNPHTGKPFIHSNSSAVVYSSASIAAPASRGRHQGKLLQQPTSAASQPQHINHLHSQPLCHPFQPSSEPAQNPTVSYHLPPLFPPVCDNQQYTVPENLNTQFSHMTLTQQPNNGAPAADGHHYAALYHHHSAPVVLHGAPQQVSNYVVAGTPGMLQGQPVPLPTPGPHQTYPSGMTGHAAFPGSTLNQPVQQVAQQLLSQMGFHLFFCFDVLFDLLCFSQVSACYCSSIHHPTCSSQQQQQHYRPPVNYLPHNGLHTQTLSQQQVHQPVMSSPASYQTIVGMQPTLNFALTGVQQSNISSQMQGMMVQYSPMQSYQVSLPQHAGPMLVSSCQPGQGAVAVSGVQPYYSLLPAPNQHTMSSTVSFLPSPMMEQLNFPQNSSSCVAQQNTGLLPPAPGSGMVMLQMAAPPCQQPPASSACQQKQPSHKHLGPERQRTRRPTDHPLPPDNMQSSLLSPPALTSSSRPPPNIKGLPTGISSIPVVTHQHQLQLPTDFCHSGPGEAHYSLLGQPLQFKPLIRTTHMVTKHQISVHSYPFSSGSNGSLAWWSWKEGRQKIFPIRSQSVSSPQEGTGTTASQNLLPQICKRRELTQRQPWLCYSRDTPNLKLASLYSTCATAQPDTLHYHSSPQPHFYLGTHSPRLGCGELCDQTGS